MGAFLAIFMVLLINVIFFSSLFTLKDRRKLLEETGARYGGRLISGPFSVPELFIPYRDRVVTVRDINTGGRSPEYFTEFDLHLSGDNRDGFRLEVYPETLSSSIGKFFGMQDLEIGAPPFDSRYILKSNSHLKLLEFLDEPTQQIIERLFYKLSDRDVYVHLDRATARIKKRGRCVNSSELEGLLELAFSLFDRVLYHLASGSLPAPLATEGIQFLPQGSSDTPGVLLLTSGLSSTTPVCPVCGQDVLQDLVSCTSCCTAHHRDCWDYNSLCSIYGCKSRRCRSGVTSPAPGPRGTPGSPPPSGPGARATGRDRPRGS